MISNGITHKIFFKNIVWTEVWMVPNFKTTVNDKNDMIDGRVSIGLSISGKHLNCHHHTAIATKIPQHNEVNWIQPSGSITGRDILLGLPGIN